MNDTGITRGCGKREPGGLYVCSELCSDGLPLDHFLIDPPVPYTGEHFRSPQIIERDGKNHILLWVGAEYYPYVSDFIEETRLYGVSKRIPKNFPIEKLEQGSKMFLIHSKAIIGNYADLPATETCPKNNPLHLSNEEYCLGQTYNFAIPNHERGSDWKLRKIGDTVYKVPYKEIDLEHEPLYVAGIFLTVPITNFDYIINENGQVDQEVASKKTDIPLRIESD